MHSYHFRSMVKHGDENHQKIEQKQGMPERSGLVSNGTLQPRKNAFRNWNVPKKKTIS